MAMEELNGATVDIPEEAMELFAEMMELIPMDHRERYFEICKRVGVFCESHLDVEYALLGLKLATYLCTEGSPAMRGKVESWVAGIMYEVAMVNFLTDPSEPMHMTAQEIAAGCGVSTATMHAKARVIREGLEIHRFDPRFCTDANTLRNPLVWMLELENGMIIDVRELPSEDQDKLFDAGYIPFAPYEAEEVLAARARAK